MAAVILASIVGGSVEWVIKSGHGCSDRYVVAKSRDIFMSSPAICSYLDWC
jgi:hypothetical protein